jgi:hypothetical protein
MAQPLESPQSEPAPEVKRILMVDFTATQVQAKGGAPPASYERGQTKATMANPPNVLPPPLASGVDRLYHQLVDMHDIATTQLAECAHWHRSNPTSNVAHAGADWRGPAVEPSAERMASLPPTDFSPQATLWQ